MFDQRLTDCLTSVLNGLLVQPDGFAVFAHRTNGRYVQVSGGNGTIDVVESVGAAFLCDGKPIDAQDEARLGELGWTSNPDGNYLLQNPEIMASTGHIATVLTATLMAVHDVQTGADLELQLEPDTLVHALLPLDA